MHALDWIFLVVLGASLLIGAWRGLIFELFSLAGWVAAFFAAQWFAADVGQRLPVAGGEGALSYAAGFAVVFVIAVFVFGLVAWLAKKMIEAACALRTAAWVRCLGWSAVAYCCWWLLSSWDSRRCAMKRGGKSPRVLMC